MKVFEIARSWADVPLIVIASDQDEAERIHREWIETHCMGFLIEPQSIHSYGGTWLGVRPLLEEVATLGRTGVAYWQPEERRWIIASPTEKPMGLITPPLDEVDYYRVEASSGDDAMVFGGSFEEATTLFCVWHIDRCGSEPEHFSMRKMSRWDLVGEFVTLRDDLEAGVTGVARRDDQGSWRIMPPDYQAPRRRGA